MKSYRLNAGFTALLIIFSFTAYSMDKPLHDIYTAAQKGDLESLNSHIQKGKAYAKALAIAASASRINVSDETYFQVIKPLLMQV